MAEMKTPQMRFAKDCVSVRSACTVRMALPPGCRFICFIAGERPILVPIFEDGTYDISMESISAIDVWPKLIAIFPAEDVPLIGNMSVEFVNDLVRQASVGGKPMQ